MELVILKRKKEIQDLEKLLKETQESLTQKRRSYAELVKYLNTFVGKAYRLEAPGSAVCLYFIDKLNEETGLLQALVLNTSTNKKGIAGLTVDQNNVYDGQVLLKETSVVEAVNLLTR